jgi:uncharacterized protein YbjT (DUF2867 family)
MSRKALVVGASGAIGEAAALMLIRVGWDVIATMRRPDAQGALLRRAGARVVQLDLDAEAPAELAAGCDAAILTPILTLSARLALRLREATRVIAFSSNNVALTPEAPKYAPLVRAEAELRAALPRAAFIRPTLIYGDPRLPTAPRIMRAAKRLPVLPMPGSGRARQQPVFHEDLARCAVFLAESGEGAGKTYALGGPDIVSMRELFAAIARAAGTPRPILPIPAAALAFAAAFAPGLRDMQIAHLDDDKLAREIDPVPPDCAPRVGLEQGLTRLSAAMVA